MEKTRQWFKVVDTAKLPAPDAYEPLEPADPGPQQQIRTNGGVTASTIRPSAGEDVSQWHRPATVPSGVSCAGVEREWADNRCTPARGRPQPPTR